ncbi:MAG: 2OG-Fe(II) oxygenase [Bacteroidota bacterium]
MPEYINGGTEKLHELARQNRKKYAAAEPFPHIQFDNFFNEGKLKEILAEFPSLIKTDATKFNNQNEKKLASKGEYLFGEQTKVFMHFLNSQPFLEFLEILTGIENLIPDPQFSGGGYHEIMPGGFLKVHADFNKHPVYKLDRRLNVIIYLNKNWEDSFGGAFELWDKDMKGMVASVMPLFNRMVVFSTNDFSFHGHPNPLTAPEGRSRKSLALYYYTNGRPAHEINHGLENHSTLFKARPGAGEKVEDSLFSKNSLKNMVLEITPPILIKAAKSILKGKK